MVPVVQPGGTQRVSVAVTWGMTSVIDRMLAAYSAAALLTVLPAVVALWDATEPWWLLVFGGGLVVSAAWMNVLAARRRPIGGAAGVYAALVPLGLVAQHWGVHENAVTQPGVMSGAVGVAVVCAGIWRGGRVALGYAGLTAVVLVVGRTGPRGGGADLLLAVCEGAFSVGAGLSILAVALGMMEAARAADDLDARVGQRELDLAVEQGVAAARAHLDQVIHDDVMTALSAASRAQDPASVAALVRLASGTLRTIDELEGAVEAQELVPFAVVRRLLAQTCARVSPRIVVRDEAQASPGDPRISVAAAEVGLSAVREALRNALRHAGAGLIEVEVSTGTTPHGDDELRVRVVDDGCGFALDEVPGERLGIRVSMGEALERPGLAHRLTSEPGVGTVFEIAWTGEPDPAVDPLPSADRPALPAAFPVRRLMSVVWAATLGMVAIGLAMLPREAAPWSLTAMVLLCALVAVVLHAGTRLVLPGWAAAAAVALALATSVVMAQAIPVVPDPSVLSWHLFPLQLVLVVLVLRRRTGTAAAALAAAVAGTLLWWSRGDLPVSTALVFNFGVVTFFVMALVVGAMLARIARRQQTLREHERAAVDDAVRASIASLQRALWASDLRSRARELIHRLSTLTAPPPAELVTDALLLEATLREEIVARNVMNEELSSLTDSARRRGVDVRIVDSRGSQASGVLARAVNAEVRATLASRGLARLVVRLAPDPADPAEPTDPSGARRGRPRPAASVVSQSGSDVTLTTIGDDGHRDTRPPAR